MVVVMQVGATEEQIQRAINKLMEMGFDIHRSTGAQHTVLGAVGARVGGAGILRPTLRVLVWGAIAMAITAGIGRLFGAVV